MMTDTPKEDWGSGDAYEKYMGCWSRKVAPEFLCWLALPHGSAWAEVGCGTGALAEAILTTCDPHSVTGIRQAEGFIAAAKRRVTDSRTKFEIGDATAMPWHPASFDATVSALTLNFVPDHEKMARAWAVKGIV